MLRTKKINRGQSHEKHVIRVVYQGADAKNESECGGGVQVYHDARLFDEIAMAQKVRPYDGQVTRRE
jgi:hypothetical protein